MSDVKPRIKIDRERGRPTRCRVWVKDLLVFDGSDHSECLTKPVEEDVPALEPFRHRMKFKIGGAVAEFMITKTEYSSGSIRFEAQDVVSLNQQRGVTP